MRVALAIAAGLSVVGCGITDPSGGARVQVRTDAPAYSSGALVTVTLTNTGSRDISYKGCPFALEVRGGYRWVETGWPAPPLVCTMEGPAGLGPGESGLLARLKLPELAAGRYRLVFDDVQVRGGAQVAYDQRASNSFQIGFVLD